MIEKTQYDIVLGVLRSAYPRAVSYGDIHKTLCPSNTDRVTKQGGRLMREMIAKGRCKKVTEGFYVYAH